MTLPIDCHVLTMPDTDPVWLAACLQDLATAGVSVHQCHGIEGNPGQARQHAFRCGQHDFVSFADPDDRYRPDAFLTLLNALASTPKAWAAFSMERKMDAAGNLLTLPANSNPMFLLSRQQHVPGLMVARREVVEGFTALFRHPLAEIWHLLDYATKAGFKTILCPVVGRYWRQHANQISLKRV